MMKRKPLQRGETVRVYGGVPGDTWSFKGEKVTVAEPEDYSAELKIQTWLGQWVVHPKQCYRIKKKSAPALPISFTIDEIELLYTENSFSVGGADASTFMSRIRQAARLKALPKDAGR